MAATRSIMNHPLQTNRKEGMTVSLWYSCNDEMVEPEVVDCDFGGLRDDLVILTDICRPEVDENVDDKHDIDYKSEKIIDDDIEHVAKKDGHSYLTLIDLNR